MSSWCEAEFFHFFLLQSLLWVGLFLPQLIQCLQCCQFGDFVTKFSYIIIVAATFIDFSFWRFYIFYLATPKAHDLSRLLSIMPIGVFDFKRCCTEWSVYDIKVPWEPFENIGSICSLIALAVLWCHIIILSGHVKLLLHTSFRWKAIFEVDEW